MDLTNKYTVLDISELTGDLLTVGMFTVLDYVWDIAKENRTEEKPSSWMSLAAHRCVQQPPGCGIVLEIAKQKVIWR